jgi:hypothetical protein
MRRFSSFFVMSAMTLALAIGAACAPPAPPPPPEPPKPTPAERGAYIVSTAGCHDCHTPFKVGPNGPEPDMTRQLSGHPADVEVPAPPKPVGPWIWGGAETNTAFYGPWGISFAFNLTPDENTGLGIWTEDMFVRAIREGKHMGQSRPILPPMPWPVYRNLTDDDLKAVFAYLRTIPKIANRVPDPKTPEDVAKMK